MAFVVIYFLFVAVPLSGRQPKKQSREKEASTNKILETFLIITTPKETKRRNKEVSFDSGGGDMSVLSFTNSHTLTFSPE